MMSCLVTIVTNSDQTYVKMCLRNVRTAFGEIILEKYKKNLMGGGGEGEEGVVAAFQIVFKSGCQTGANLKWQL